MSVGIISVKPTIVLTAYTAGDVIGGLLTFTRASFPPGTIAFNQVTIVDVDQQKEAYVLHLFNDTPTTIADDAAYATNILIADLNNEIKQVTIAALDYVDTGTVGSTAFKAFDNVYAQNERGVLYGYLVATDTPDYVTLLALTLNLHYVSL